MIAPDWLRPPAATDPTADAYKDWLHLNVFDHESGLVGLVNVSLHGDPADPRARAVGTGLLFVPGSGWAGRAEVLALDDASLGECSIATEIVGLSVHHRSGSVAASVRVPEEELALSVTATAQVGSIVFERRPLGPGWFSWYGVPRLSVQGEAVVDGRRIPLDWASAYYDHNWGRWHWGDDLGWVWGAFLTPAPGPAFIVTQPTDKSHRRRGSSKLVVTFGDGRLRIFEGPGLELAHEGSLDGLDRRVPGALAALHGGRAAMRPAARFRLVADDGRDHVALEFAGRSAVQVIAADPARPGYGFIHETVGEFASEGRVGGIDVAGAGLGVLEHAD